MSPTSEGEGIDWNSLSSDDIVEECRRQRLVNIDNLPEGLKQMGIDANNKAMGRSWNHGLPPIKPTPEVVKPVCTCGAKYTSNPNWHMPRVCDLAD